jgi:hypothetical protein
VRGTSGCMHECRSEGATDGALEGVTHLGCSQASLGQSSLQELGVLSQLGLHRVQACRLQVTVSDLPPVHRALLITTDEREPRRACPTHTRTHAHTHTRTHAHTQADTAHGCKEHAIMDTISRFGCELRGQASTKALQRVGRAALRLRPIN